MAESCVPTTTVKHAFYNSTQRLTHALTLAVDARFARVGRLYSSKAKENGTSSVVQVGVIGVIVIEACSS